MTLQQAYELGFQKAAEHYETKMRKSAERRAVLHKAAQTWREFSKLLQPKLEQPAAVPAQPQMSPLLSKLVGYGRRIAQNQQGAGRVVGNAVNNAIKRLNPLTPPPAGINRPVNRLTPDGKIIFADGK